MADYGGWTGKILCVDLTSGQLSTEPTWQWVPGRIGAIGIGLALLWARVPAGTGALDPENLLFIGVGPLTGSWAPCAGRAVAVSLSPAGYPVEHVGQGSVGGQWPAELKWAGFDGIAITGRSSKPVFLAISNGQAKLYDADNLWGLDTFAAQKLMQQSVGDGRAKALVIGPAGEKLARNAALIHGTGHALGQCGFGAVAGSKNLKGIILRGTGRVATATPLASFRDRLKQIRRLLALMQSVVSCAKDNASRWRAREGLVWEGGSEPVPIGPVEADDLSRQGHRHCGSDFYMGGLLKDWHVKNSGCTGCVMNCFSTFRGQGLPADVPSHAEAHCVQMQTGNFWRIRNHQPVARASPQTVFANIQRADLLGINSYDINMLLPLLVRLRFAEDGSFYQALDSHLQQQLAALPFDSLDTGGDGGLTFFTALFELMAGATPGEDNLDSWLLQGAPRAAARFGMYDDIWTGTSGDFDGYENFRVQYGAHGQRSHYGPDRFGLPAGLHWVIWNRDPNRHEHNGLVAWSGLSWQQKQRIAEIHFGHSNAIDNPALAWKIGDATPARIELARMLAVRSMLKDSLSLCDWVFPNYCCPDAQREFAGDLNLEAELYTAITGEMISAEQLDLRAEALVDLYRAITVRDWNTSDMRGSEGYQSGGRGADYGGDYRGHDNLAAWYFELTNEPHLDRAQFEQAKTMFYERFGWDPDTGCVTRSKLELLEQGSVADGLATLGLLPDD